MSRVAAPAQTPVVRVIAGALVAAAAFIAAPAPALANDTETVTDARLLEVQQATALEGVLDRVQPAAATPKKIVANFTARSLAAIRATRSASMFRWGTPSYAKWYAKSHIDKKYDWGTKQFGCLVSLWNKESHWNYRSANRRGGWYGIPQANTGIIKGFGSTLTTFMRTPEVQVQAGAKYINYRYGSPCSAYAHSKRTGWY